MFLDTAFRPIRECLTTMSMFKLQVWRSWQTLAISLHVLPASRICLRRCSSTAVQGVFVLLLFLADSSVCTRFPIDSGPAELLSLGDSKGGGLGSSATPGDAARLRDPDSGVRGGGAVLSGRGSTATGGGTCTS